MQPKARYIPQNSEAIAFPGIPATVYKYTAKNGLPAAIAYVGNSSKPAWAFFFHSEEQRQQKIDDLFTNVLYHERQKAERRTEKTSFRHGYRPGDIVYESWGYDQTNINYYEITATTEKTVTFREVAQRREATGFMSGSCVPVPGSFLDRAESHTRTVQRPYDGKGKGSIPYARHPGSNTHTLREWAGQPQYFSEYA